MPQLDNYLVTLGVKGQDVVLSQMDKIRKGKKDLSKKATVNLTTKDGKAKKAAAPEAKAEKTPAPTKTPEKLADQAKKENEKVKKTHKEESEREKKNNSAFKDAAGKFGQGVQGFASAASSLDPVSTISSITSAIGTSLSGISAVGISLGRMPEGIASIANSTLSMAKNSVDMAKQATAGFYALTSRNAAASHYGGRVGQAQMSNAERAMFIDAVSGSMGRIQPELADVINKLIGTKDTRALARVAAGDWESTGEDKGWMIGQMMGSMGNLPPSIRQKIQASLLGRNAGIIQGMEPGGEQAGAQANAAAFVNREEAQTGRAYTVTLGEDGKTNENILGMVDSLNTMQVGLYKAGLLFAEEIDKATTELAALPAKVKNLGTALDELAKNPSIKSVAAVMSSMSSPPRPTK